MPAIKKKWIKASQDGGNVPEDDNDDNLGDDDRELGAASEPASGTVPKVKKRPAQSPQNSLLRGLDGEVLLEKRKRFIPPAELKLSEWLDCHLEKRTEETLYLPHLYTYYTELCQGDGSDILDVPEFNRMVKEKFGKAFGVKETSVYKSLIKERKINQEKKKTGSGIKLKEIVHEAINHFGNPWSGVRFFALKQYIGTKYPALQIDLRPKLLKRALEMGTQYGQIDLVKGIGMAGFYKLPGGEPPPKPKPKSKKEEGNEKTADETGDTKTSEETEEKPTDSAENGEKKEETEETKLKKKHKQKKVEKISFSKLHHGNPEKMEDTFPLAITYQSAPKSASVPRIRRYIQEKYGEVVQDGRWRKAIESGAEKGYWEHVSGSGITGSLHLLMDDFNPGSDQIEDMICAAIIACHEPKSASANQIKKYVSQYHPEFKVDERPDKFKKALLRAVSKNMIVQLSGLGASGSFQLTSAFTPSPVVLAGEDDTSEEEGYDSDEPAYVPRGTKSRGNPKLKTVKATTLSSKSVKNKGQKKLSSASSKGRVKGRVNSYAESSDEEHEKASKTKKKLAPKGKQNQEKTSRKQVHSPLPSDDENEEEPEYTPRKSQSRGGLSQSETKVKQTKKKAAKPSKVKTSKSTKKVESDDEEESSSETEKKSKAPKKADSFDGGHPTSKGKATKPPKNVAPVEKDETSPAKKNKKQPAKADKKSASSSSLSSVPPQSKSPKTPKKATHAKKSTVESDEGDVDSGTEPEYMPRKSKSRGGIAEGNEKVKGKTSRSRK